MGFRQSSFLGGEIAPTLWNKTDMQRYGESLRTMRNFFPSVHGAAVSRPGTTYVGQTKDQTYAAKLVGFVYSDSQSFVLEFGNNYIRVFGTGGFYIGEISAGAPFFNYAIPYTTADLPKLKFAQQGAVMTITHPSYAPAELTYTGSTWTYTAISFDVPGPPWWPTGGGGPLWPGHANSRTDGRFEAWPADSAHPMKDCDWVATLLTRDARGVVSETLPSTPFRKDILPGANHPLAWASLIAYGRGSLVSDGMLSPTYYCSLQDNNTGNAVTSTAWWEAVPTLPAPYPLALYTDMPLVIAVYFPPGYTNLIGVRLYRGRAGIYGWLADLTTTVTLATINGLTTAAAYTDQGDQPDFSRAPPQGTNPFKVYNGATLVRTENPGAVCFFDQRRCFARTDYRPGYVWGSSVGNYTNFDRHLVIPTANEEVEFDIASRKLEEIRSLVGLNQLLAFTNSSVWAITGAGNGAPLAFDSVNAKVQEEVGASWLAPVVVGGSPLYVRTKGYGIRGLSYDFASQRYVGTDLSVVASHLFVGHQIVDWCYAEDPWGLVWAVREDGLLISITYTHPDQVWGFARHDTQGAVMSVCSVPESTEDFVYMVVKRTVGGADSYMIERMASRVIVDVTQAICLDSAKQFFPFRGAPFTTCSGLDYLEGMVVWALVDGNVQGPFTVTGGAITLTIQATEIATVGLAYTPQLLTLDPPSERLKQKTVTEMGFDVDSSRGLFVGQDLDHLKEWRERQPADNFDALQLESVRVRAPVLGKWGKTATAALQQSSPLPVTVTALEWEVDVGG